MNRLVVTSVTLACVYYWTPLDFTRDIRVVGFPFVNVFYYLCTLAGLLKLVHVLLFRNPVPLLRALALPFAYYLTCCAATLAFKNHEFFTWKIFFQDTLFYSGLLVGVVVGVGLPTRAIEATVARLFKTAVVMLAGTYVLIAANVVSSAEADRSYDPAMFGLATFLSVSAPFFASIGVDEERLILRKVLLWLLAAFLLLGYMSIESATRSTAITTCTSAICTTYVLLKHSRAYRPILISVTVFAAVSAGVIGSFYVRDALSTSLALRFIEGSAVRDPRAEELESIALQFSRDRSAHLAGFGFGIGLLVPYRVGKEDYIANGTHVGLVNYYLKGGILGVVILLPLIIKIGHAIVNASASKKRHGAALCIVAYSTQAAISGGSSYLDYLWLATFVCLALAHLDVDTRQIDPKAKGRR